MSLENRYNNLTQNQSERAISLLAFRTVMTENNLFQIYILEFFIEEYD